MKIYPYNYKATNTLMIMMMMIDPVISRQLARALIRPARASKIRSKHSSFPCTFSQLRRSAFARGIHHKERKVSSVIQHK